MSDNDPKRSPTKSEICHHYGQEYQLNAVGLVSLFHDCRSLHGKNSMNEVIIKDIQMPFWSMVIFMVKWAFAAIPAIIIIAIFVAALAGMLGGLFGVQ